MPRELAHLNYAGAGIVSPGVDLAIREYLDLEREIGPYEAEARVGTSHVEHARASAGRLLGCPSEAVALFDNATRAWGTLVTNLSFRPGDTVWVSAYEYVSNLYVVANLRKHVGLDVVPIPMTPRGELDLGWVDRNLTDDVALVTVSHIPSCAGVVADVEALGARLRGSRALYVVDGCQAVGNVAIDVAAIGCDVYTGAGRKFLSGPRGTGFAAVSSRYLAAAEPAVLDVHAQTVSPTLHAESTVATAVDLELSERSIAVWSGLAVAIDEHLDSGPEVAARRRRLLERVEQAAAGWPGVRRLGDAPVRSGICSLIIDSPPARQVYDQLRARGVNTWIGVGSHTPLYAPGEGGTEFLRISIGDRTTDAEVDRLLAELAELLNPAGKG